MNRYYDLSSISYEDVMGVPAPEGDDGDENGFPYSTAHDFKMGICDIFAVVLYKEFYYIPLQVDDEHGNLEHAFCFDLDSTMYVDASGWYETAEELLGHPAEPKALDLDKAYREIKENRFYQREGYDFAKAFVSKYRERYDRH